MFAIVLLIIGLLVAYLCFKAFKNKSWLGGIILAFVALFFLAGSYTVHSEDSYSKQESSQQSSSSQDSSDKAYWSSAKKAKSKAKQGLTKLNEKIGEDDRLNGLVVRLSKNDTDGTMYEVKVPDAALNGNDEQIRETFKTVFNLISQYTGADDPTVYYYDDAGNQVAHTSTSGDIKLDK